MKATRSSDTRALLASLSVRPLKRLGQNFLCDENMARWIVRRAGIGPDSHVLEIGPGLGALTEFLAQEAGRVVAIEADIRLYGWLKERYATCSNVSFIHADALEVEWASLFDPGASWMLVSNLPYASGTRMMMRMFEMDDPPSRALVTLQADVAERLVAEPGAPAYGLLAIWRGRWFDARMIRAIPPACFYPPPHVASSVVELRRRSSPRCAPRNPEHFRDLTRLAFMRRRKQMRRILLDLPVCMRPPDGFVPEDILRAVGVAPDARPETIAVESWGALADLLGQARDP